MSVSVRVKNFGPLERATLDLKPLTVLIGPNNSGKSVAAMLVYAVTQAAATGLPFTYPYRRTRLDEPNRLPLSRIAAAMADEDTGWRLPASLAALVTQSGTSQLVIFGQAVLQQIERCFSAPLSQMWRTTRQGRYPFRITLTDDVAGWQIELEGGEPSNNVTVLRTGKPRDTLIAALNQIPAPAIQDLHHFDEGIDRIWMYIQREISRTLFRGFPTQSYYLPAERSGILQSHRQLASFVVRQAPFAGIEDLQVPRMSGTVGDFIGNLLSLDSDQLHEFDWIANELENDLYDGHIRIEPDTTGYPNLSYQTAQSDYPLHRASSMVSEIAPIVVYLRHLLDAGELFIIEEPESHLHPRSQVALASAIAAMVECGLRVLLTTHSDYFLGQINNEIRSETARRRSGPESDTDELSLGSENVSAYLFVRAGTATRVSNLEVSDEQGISDEEFSRVTDDLYEQTARLEAEIDG